MAALFSTSLPAHADPVIYDRIITSLDGGPDGAPELIGRTQGGFVTCRAVRIDVHGHGTMANAGHCQPYLERREVDLPDGLPLGIVEDAEYG